MNATNSILRAKISALTQCVVNAANRYGCKTCDELLSNKEFKKNCVNLLGIPYSVVSEFLKCGAVNTEVIELAFNSNK